MSAGFAFAVCASVCAVSAGIGFFAGYHDGNEHAGEYAHDKYVYGFAVGYCTGLQNSTAPDLDEIRACADDYLRHTGQGELAGWT